MENIIKMLEEIPVFSTFDRWTLQYIAGFAKPKRYRPKEWLFRQSQPREWLGIVEQGEVLIVRHSEEQGSCVAVLGQGAILAERLLLEDLPHTVSCIAQEGTVVFQLSRKALDRIRKERPDVHFQIIARANEIMNDRMRYAAARPTMESILPPEHESGTSETDSIWSILGKN